jgi:hypothetical protein
MSETDLTLTQGDEKPYNLTFTGASDPIDITGTTVTMTIKRSLSDATATLTKVVTDHTDPVNGKTTITLSPTDTGIATGSYYYDVQIDGGSISKTTVLKGKLVVSWQATKD